MQDAVGFFGRENGAPLLADNQLRTILASDENIFSVGCAACMAGHSGRWSGGRRVGGAVLQSKGHRCGHILCSGYGVLFAILQLLDVLGNGVLCSLPGFVGHIESVYRALHFCLKLVQLALVVRYPVGGSLRCGVLLRGDVSQRVCQLRHGVLVATVDGTHHAGSQACGLFAAILDVGHQSLVVLLGDTQIVGRGSFQGFDVGRVGVPVVELRIKRSLRRLDVGVQIVLGFSGRFIE